MIELPNYAFSMVKQTSPIPSEKMQKKRKKSRNTGTHFRGAHSSFVETALALYKFSLFTLPFFVVTVVVVAATSAAAASVVCGRIFPKESDALIANYFGSCNCAAFVYKFNNLPIHMHACEHSMHLGL